MKKRILSAIVILLIFIPVLYFGGLVFNIAVYLLSLLGLKEFLDIKSTKKQVPNFIMFISYVMLTLFVLNTLSQSSLVFKIDYRIMAGLFLIYLIPVIIYNNSKIYSVNDAFFLIGSIFFLGSSFALISLIRDIRLAVFVYLILVAVITDTYAYITGSLIGKHKMLEKISPKKTWEGMIGGTLFGVIIPMFFYHTVVNSSLSLFILFIMTLFLSIVGQFGDLVFSAIKRYFGKKDFSNLIPGHGGILDRFDSIIFIVLSYIFFISII